MSQLDVLTNVLPAIPILLAHLAGVVVAIVLLVRQRRKPVAAVLALVGFGLLLLLDLANFARGPVLRQLLHRMAVGDRAAVIGVHCCCGIFDVAGIVCLIIAIWQATSGAGMKEGS
jgi:hypothetical protein